MGALPELLDDEFDKRLGSRRERFSFFDDLTDTFIVSCFDDDSRILDKTPMKRRGGLEELYGLLLYLASDASSSVTGQTFLVDGGWTES